MPSTRDSILAKAVSRAVEASSPKGEKPPSHGTRHAIHYVLTVIDLDPDADPPKVLAIGPDPADNFVEVIWLELADDVELVIYAMALRSVFYELAPTRRGQEPMTTRKSKTNRTLTDDDLDAIAAEVETADYDIQQLKTRRRDRPAMVSVLPMWCRYT